MLATGTPSGLWSHSFEEILKLDQTFLDIWELWRRQWRYWWQRYQGQNGQYKLGSWEAQCWFNSQWEENKCSSLNTRRGWKVSPCASVPLSQSWYCPRSKFVSLEFSDDPSSDRILVSILLPVELHIVLVFTLESTFAKVWESSSTIQSNSRIRKTNKVSLAGYQLLDNSYFCAVNVGLTDP